MVHELFRTESAILSPSSGNFLMRKTYISAISFSTATSFQVFSPLVPEISDQFGEDVGDNTLDAIELCTEQWRGIWEQMLKDAFKAYIWVERRPETEKKLIQNKVEPG